MDSKTSLFDAIRQHVTARAAAELYGLKVVRSGRALCPWHDDHKPDLAFYEDRCYCHACHNGGDAVALVAQMFGLSMLDSAKKINADFRLGLDADTLLKQTGPTVTQKRQWQREHDRTHWAVLCDVVREADARLQKLDSDRDKAWDNPQFVTALEARSRADLILESMWTEAKQRGCSG